MQIHMDFKVKKTTSLSWIFTFYTFAIHVLYFAVQHVEEYNIKMGSWADLPSVHLVWLNQYNKGIPLGKQTGKRACQYAVVRYTLRIA